jgi:hypothetical protein
MEKQLSLAKAELEVQREKLNTIKEFQFLRTAEEKDNQIRNQVLVIEKQEKEIEKPYKNLNEQEEDLRKMMGELRMLEGE